VPYEASLKASLWGGHSLLLLCEKFDYYSEPLCSYIHKNVMSGFIFSPFFHSRDFNNSKFHFSLSLHQFGIAIKSFSSKALSAQSTLADELYLSFIEKLNKINQDPVLGIIEYMFPK
jgi:hypothetical protein